MTTRFGVVLCVLLVTGLCALSLGGQVFYMISYALILMSAYAVASVLLSRALLRLEQQTTQGKVPRGAQGGLTIRVHNPSPLPLAPIELQLALPQGGRVLYVDTLPWRAGEAQLDFQLPHVGVVHAGVARVYLSDLFGLLRVRRRVSAAPQRMVVLPRAFDVSQLHFLQQDDGRAIPNRTTEDITSPEDTRAWRTGDSMKRIHWKLSSRKRELLVRRFEMPAPPDTLILMDCSDPQGGENQSDGLMRLRDTLCETALSVAKIQMEAGHPVRMPLYGAHASEFHADRAGNLAILQEELAYQIFRGGEPFDKVLNVELRRMRRTGATVVITTRLDAAVIEGVKHIRRSGPSVRFYLVTFQAEHEDIAPMIAQLQRHLVEVCYVTPA